MEIIKFQAYYIGFQAFWAISSFFKRFLRLLCFSLKKQTFPRHFKILWDFSRSFETFRDFSRFFENYWENRGPGNPSIQQPGSHIGSILRQICCPHTILGHTSVGRIGNMCHTWRIVAVGNLAMFVVALLPPSLGVRFCSPKVCRLDSHRTVPNMFRYWLDHESCLGTAVSSSVICGFVTYYVDGGADFSKHMVPDVCFHSTNHRTPIASRTNWHFSRVVLLAISMSFPRSRVETAQKISKFIVGETKNKTRRIISKMCTGVRIWGVWIQSHEAENDMNAKNEPIRPIVSRE